MWPDEAVVSDISRRMKKIEGEMLGEPRALLCLPISYSYLLLNLFPIILLFLTTKITTPTRITIPAAIIALHGIYYQLLYDDCAAVLLPNVPDIFRQPRRGRR